MKPMRQRWREWWCMKFGHKWRWEAIANNKSAHFCARCGERQKIETKVEPPRTPDWWKAKWYKKKPP